MKRILLIIVLACAGTAHAQIPTTDVANIGARAIEHAKQIQEYIKQYDQLVAQYERLTRTHEALTGVRNLGDIFDSPLLRSYLPRDWTTLYRSYRRRGYEGVFRTGVDIVADMRVPGQGEGSGDKHDSCAHIQITAKRKDCEARIVQPAQDTGDIIEIFDHISLRTDQITELQAQINLTEDPKAIAELQARIGTEQAAIANMTAQIMAAGRMSDANRGMLDSRQREWNSVTWRAEGGVELEPLTFTE